MSDDYIEVYPHALDPGACADWIVRFERSGKAVRGRSASGIDLRMKDSWDICIDEHPEWRDAVNVLNTAMMGALVRYVRRYPYTILGPLTLRRSHPTAGADTIVDAASLQALSDAALQVLLATTFRPGTINLQKYFADQGGYPAWHCEQYPRAGDVQCEALHRILLWSVYLNDEFTGGETEFVQPPRQIVPATGSMLIAPASFTHTHRGNRPIGGDKYLATSWVLFQRADTLFPGQA